MHKLNASQLCESFLFEQKWLISISTQTKKLRERNYCASLKKTHIQETNSEITESK